MIAAGNDKLRAGHSLLQQFEGLDHQFEPLVSSPLAESEDAMGIAAAGEIRKFGAVGEDAMRAKVHVVASVLVVENLAISGHEHGNGIGQQQHARGHRTRCFIEPGMTNTGIFEIDGVHEVMQGDVGIAPAEAREERRGESAKGNDGIAPESAEQKVEPHDVGLAFIDRSDQTEAAARIIERPATDNLEAFWLFTRSGEFIREDGQAEKWIAL